LAEEKRKDNESIGVESKQRLTIAQETIDILECPTRPGKQVSIADDLRYSCDGTVIVDAATSTLWQQNASAMTNDKVEPVPTIRVINATTFAVARYMTLRHSTDN
jgi:hypothetical protein